MIVVSMAQDEFAKGLALPEYATAGAAGMDLRASHDFALDPGERMIVSTGITMEIPSGFEGQVRPRSGLASKFGISLVNAPGTIDSDYRGVVGVILINLSRDKFVGKRGDRIAQIVFAPVSYARVHLVEQSEITQTARDSGGFGHTGTS